MGDAPQHRCFGLGRLSCVIHSQDDLVAEPVAEHVHRHGEDEGDNDPLPPCKSAADKYQQDRETDHEDDCFRGIHSIVSQATSQQLDRMCNLELDAQLLSSISELKHASGIPRCQYIYMRFFDLFHLLIKDLHRKLILRDVVNPCAAATLIGAFDFHELNSRYCLQ